MLIIKNGILVLEPICKFSGLGGPVQELHDTAITAEANYLINFIELGIRNNIHCVWVMFQRILQLIT